MQILKKTLFFLTFFLIASSIITTSSFAQVAEEKEPEHYVSVRLISDKSEVKAGDIVRIGLEQTIHPKWHTYWKNPGDSGTPTEIEWKVAPNFKFTVPEWPTPKKLPYGPLTNYGYEGTVTLLQNLILPPAIPSGPFMINGTVNLLVCHEICIPETHDVALVFNGGRIAETGLIEKAEATLPKRENWAATYYESGENFIINVETDSKNILTAQNVVLAPENWGAIDNNADVRISETQNGFQLIQKRGERDLSEIENLPIVLNIDGQGVRLTAALASENASVPTQAIKLDTLLIKAIFFAFLGGIILNLMPCVFPVLSMKALSLVNLNKKEEKTARKSGIAYTEGILVSFGIIAAILLALKAGGEQIGWGFQLQNPIVITILIYLIFALGLNLSGFFEFSSRFTNIGSKLTQKSGHHGAFFTGILATIVATPCTAPFMGSAMGFALTQPPFVSMLVFLTLGFGLAFPYLLLCYVPALRAKLPRPGAWMETFRQFLAFPMFATAAWLVWVLSQQVSSIDVLCVLFGLIALALIIWLQKIWPQNKAGKIFSILLVIVSIFFIVTPLFSSNNNIIKTEQTISQNWETFSPSLLNQMLDGDKPVFVNMTAAWCITCKVNERVALDTDATKRLFQDMDVQYLKGDWTNKDPSITNYLNSFERSGVPIYVYYGPRNVQSGLRPEPLVLPQILTPGAVEKALQQPRNEEMK